MADDFDSMPDGWGLFDQDKRRHKSLLDALGRIRKLLEQIELDQAEQECAHLLEMIESKEYNRCAPLSKIRYVEAEIHFYIAKLHFQKGQFLNGESFTDLMNMFMQKALVLTKDTMSNDNLSQMYLHAIMLRELGYIDSSVEKMIEASRVFMELDADFENVSEGRIMYMENCARISFRILQLWLHEAEDFQRALVWIERQHTRDFLYTCYHTDKSDMAAFDNDDKKAWLEIQSISINVGKETVILVLNWSRFDYKVTSYLLYNGQIVRSEAFRVIEHISSSELLSGIWEGVPGMHDELALHYLQKYHRAIIGPFASELEKIHPKRIIFVPTEDLPFVPYSALMDDNEEFLIQKYSICVVSSLRLLRQCNKRIEDLDTRGNSTRSALVVGNPTSDLASSIEESQHVCTTLERAKFHTVNQLYEAEATKEKVLEAFSECNWIHMACHCEVSEKYPEGALLFKGMQTLTGQDILDRKCPMMASAAVLSACSSGKGRVFTEGILALPRSFHLQGVPSVVMSLWKVDDEATMQLMTRLYEALGKGMEIADALQEAIVGMIYEEDFGTRRLIKQWAGFIISGSPITKLELKVS